MCVFQVEVAEKHAFFGQKCLKKMCIFQVEVAEKCAFFMWKWLKNMRFLGRSV
jgi:hypothetical protein